MAAEKDAIEILKKVNDPELGMSVVDMGFVESISLKNGALDVEMILTTPFCPMANLIASDAQKSLENSGKFKKVSVRINKDKQWNPKRLSNEARRALGFE